jgi:hypothetical protein
MSPRGADRRMRAGLRAAIVSILVLGDAAVADPPAPIPIVRDVEGLASTVIAGRPPDLQVADRIAVVGDVDGDDFPDLAFHMTSRQVVLCPSCEATWSDESCIFLDTNGLVDRVGY